MDSINVSNQYANNSVTERAEFSDSSTPVIDSALAHANMKSLAVKTATGLGVTLVESPVSGLLVLRAQADKAALESALKSSLQLELPGVLSSSSVSSNGKAYCVRWIAPDEWWLSCPLQEAFEIEQGIRASAGASSIAVVNVSGGFTSIMLSGANANEVLKKSVTYDVHPSHFTPGKVVNTVFSKAQVTMRCIDVNHYELIVRRSFADYVWLWLQVASAEYGLSIEVDA